MVDIQAAESFIHFTGDGRLNLFIHNSSKIDYRSITSDGNSLTSVGTVVAGVYSPSDGNFKSFKQTWEDKVPGDDLYFNLTGPEYNDYDERLYFSDADSDDLRFSSTLSVRDAIQQHCGTSVLFGHAAFTPIEGETYYIANLLSLAPEQTPGLGETRPVVLSPKNGTVDSLYVTIACPSGPVIDLTNNFSIHNITTSTSESVSLIINYSSKYQSINFQLASPLTVSKGDELQIRFSVDGWSPGLGPEDIVQSINAFIGI